MKLSKGFTLTCPLINGQEDLFVNPYYGTNYLQQKITDDSTNKQPANYEFILNLAYNPTKIEKAIQNNSSTVELESTLQNDKTNLSISDKIGKINLLKLFEFVKLHNFFMKHDEVNYSRFEQLKEIAYFNAIQEKELLTVNVNLQVEIGNKIVSHNIQEWWIANYKLICSTLKEILNSYSLKALINQQFGLNFSKTLSLKLCHRLASHPRSSMIKKSYTIDELADHLVVLVEYFLEKFVEKYLKTSFDFWQRLNYRILANGYTLYHRNLEQFTYKVKQLEDSILDKENKVNQDLKQELEEVYNALKLFSPNSHLPFLELAMADHILRERFFPMQYLLNYISYSLNGIVLKYDNSLTSKYHLQFKSINKLEINQTFNRNPRFTKLKAFIDHETLLRLNHCYLYSQADYVFFNFYLAGKNNQYLMIVNSEGIITYLRPQDDYRNLDLIKYDATALEVINHTNDNVLSPYKIGHSKQAIYINLNGAIITPGFIAPSLSSINNINFNECPTQEEFTHSLNQAFKHGVTSIRVILDNRANFISRDWIRLFQKWQQHNEDILLGVVANDIEGGMHNGEFAGRMGGQDIVQEATLYQQLMLKGNNSIMFNSLSQTSALSLLLNHKIYLTFYQNQLCQFFKLAPYKVIKLHELMYMGADNLISSAARIKLSKQPTQYSVIENLFLYLQESCAVRDIFNQVPSKKYNRDYLLNLGIGRDLVYRYYSDKSPSFYKGLSDKSNTQTKNIATTNNCFNLEDLEENLKFYNFRPNNKSYKEIFGVQAFKYDNAIKQLSLNLLQQDIFKQINTPSNLLAIQHSIVKDVDERVANFYNFNTYLRTVKLINDNNFPVDNINEINYLNHCTEYLKAQNNLNLSYKESFTLAKLLYTGSKDERKLVTAFIEEQVTKLKEKVTIELEPTSKASQYNWELANSYNRVGADYSNLSVDEVENTQELKESSSKEKIINNLYCYKLQNKAILANNGKDLTENSVQYSSQGISTIISPISLNNTGANDTIQIAKFINKTSLPYLNKSSKKTDVVKVLQKEYFDTIDCKIDSKYKQHLLNIWQKQKILHPKINQSSLDVILDSKENDIFNYCKFVSYQSSLLARNKEWGNSLSLAADLKFHQPQCNSKWLNYCHAFYNFKPEHIDSIDANLLRLRFCAYDINYLDEFSTFTFCNKEIAKRCFINLQHLGKLDDKAAYKATTKCKNLTLSQLDILYQGLFPLFTNQLQAAAGVMTNFYSLEQFYWIKSIFPYSANQLFSISQQKLNHTPTTPEQIVKSLMQQGLTFAQSINTLTTIPAKSLNNPFIGRLEEGALANFNLWNANKELISTFIYGLCVNHKV